MLVNRVRVLGGSRLHYLLPLSVSIDDDYTAIKRPGFFGIAKRRGPLFSITQRAHLLTCGAHQTHELPYADRTLLAESQIILPRTAFVRVAFQCNGRAGIFRQILSVSLEYRPV